MERPVHYHELIDTAKDIVGAIGAFVLDKILPREAVDITPTETPRDEPMHDMEYFGLGEHETIHPHEPTTPDIPFRPGGW